MKLFAIGQVILEKKILGKMENVNRTAKTVMIFLAWTCMGMNIEIPGPTMIDLKLRFQSTYDEIARAVSAVGLGMALGSVIAGLLVDTLGPWRELLITFSQLGVSVTLVFMPYVHNVNTLWFVFLIMGSTIGAIFVAGQRIMIIMWQSRVNVPMLVLHTCAGLGSTVAPLICNNFLAKLKFGPEFGNASTTVSTLAVTSSYTAVSESRVHLGYITFGGINAVLSIPYFVHSLYKCFQRLGRGGYVNVDGASEGDTEDDQGNKTSRSLLEIIDPATYTNGARGFGVFLIIVLFLFLFNSFGGLRMFSNFIRTFAIDELRFRRHEAFYLDTALWSSLTVGRLLAAILAHCLAIRKVLVASVILYTVVVAFLILFSGSGHTSMWLLTVLFGVTIGPSYPAFLTFANMQMEVRGVIFTFAMLTGGFGYQFYVWFTGSLYDAHGPRVVLYALQTSAAITLVVSIIFVGSTYSRGERFGREPPNNTEETDIETEMDSTSDQMNDR